MKREVYPDLTIALKEVSKLRIIEKFHYLTLYFLVDYIFGEQ